MGGPVLDRFGHGHPNARHGRRGLHKEGFLRGINLHNPQIKRIHSFVGNARRLLFVYNRKNYSIWQQRKPNC